MQATWDKMGIDYKRSMIDREHGRITIGRQCELLGISRSSYYYKKVRNPEKEQRDERAKALILEIYCKYPYYGKPEIFNTDQGSQFTCSDFIGILEKAGVQISMDSKGRALDNIYCERLWRTVKYEEIFLKRYDSVPHLKRTRQIFQVLRLQKGSFSSRIQNSVGSLL